MKLKLTVISAAVAVMLGLLAAGCGKSARTGEDSTVISTGEAAPAATHSAEQNIEGLPTVIDFYATWCGPCRQIAPLFETLKEEYAGKINFVSVDVDADKDVALKYNIEAMPTFVFLDSEGNEVNRIVGADVEALKAAVGKLAR